MNVTLADVAREAGISASTVSRAFSAPDKVNSETAERVRRIAQRMGYNPPQTVRPGPSTRTETIGLIVPDIANPFFPPIIKAVQERAGTRGRTVLIADVDEYAADELRRATLMSRQVDGLIIVSPRTPEPRLPELAALQPLVVINRQFSGVASVTIEDSTGIFEAVEHLVALGHRTISYLNGPKRSWSNAQRLSAMREACEKASVELVEFGPFEPQIQAGVRAADLVNASDATAVVAYDDLIALGLMARLNERGIRVGSDLSVIGIDDSPMSGMAYPTLTSIHVPGAGAGRTAVDMVLDMAEAVAANEPIEPFHTSTQLETRLIVRSSTAPVAAERRR